MFYFTLFMSKKVFDRDFFPDLVVAELVEDRAIYHRPDSGPVFGMCDLVLLCHWVPSGCEAWNSGWYYEGTDILGPPLGPTQRCGPNDTGRGSRPFEVEEIEVFAV